MGNLTVYGNLHSPPSLPDHITVRSSCACSSRCQVWQNTSEAPYPFHEADVFFPDPFAMTMYAQLRRHGCLSNRARSTYAHILTQDWSSRLKADLNPIVGPTHPIHRCARNTITVSADRFLCVDVVLTIWIDPVWPTFSYATRRAPPLNGVVIAQPDL